MSIYVIFGNKGKIKRSSYLSYKFWILEMTEKLNSQSHSAKTTIRVGVVGVGMMGQHHARIYSQMKDVELVAVVDIDEVRSRQIAEKYQCESYNNIEKLIGKVDAVTLAVPSHLHAELGAYFFSHGIHCLIEKPLALNAMDCQDLIQISAKKKLVLCVGHIEHFNPAILQLSRILEQDHSIQAITIQRLSGHSKRITDVDVVMDLMIHDLEILLFLMRGKAEVVHVAAQAFSEKKSGEADYANALIQFSNGTIANLQASRITQHKVRKLSMTSSLGYITLDYIGQELLIHQQMQNEMHQAKINLKETVYSKNDKQNYEVDLNIEKVQVRQQEPLVAELQNFIASIREGKILGVTGEQALEALKLGWKIQEQIKDNHGLLGKNTSHSSHKMKFPSTTAATAAKEKSLKKVASYAE